MTITHYMPPIFDPALTQRQEQGWHKDALLLSGPKKANDAELAWLAATLSGSSHLHRLASLFPDDIPRLIASRGGDILAETEADWAQAHAKAQNDNQLITAVRLFRNRCHLTIAISELWGAMSLERSCQALSKCAQLGVYGSVDYLLNGASQIDCGWVILALGKLGAGELNYSSDIDLIVLHSEALAAKFGSGREQHPISLTKRLSHLLSVVTTDGFGWRVDFRLRPDPAATPVSLGLPAAISYYESTARSWERAAFIRARPIAGDLAMGEAFLSTISPFIWRRNFDYTIIDDLQIWLRHLPTPQGYLGFDVKQGAFGIRHIELLVHILQLLGGGRHRELRCSGTKEAIKALTKLDWIDHKHAEALLLAYYQWRSIEHRLQYQRDTQTHKLPRDDAGMAQFAAFCGFDTKELIATLMQLQQTTLDAARHPIFDNMLERVKQRQSHTPDIFTGGGENNQSIDWLEELGFKRAQDIVNIIDGWTNGRIAATRGERSRQYLLRFLPKLLTELVKAPDPDAAFARFADFVTGLSAGAQPFALLCEHPHLASLISDIMIKAPALTDQLCRRPDLFDSILESSFFTPLEKSEQLGQHAPVLSEDDVVETSLDQLKRWAHEAQFRAKLHLLKGISSHNEVSRFLSDIADICIRQVTKLAVEDFTRRHGHIEGGDLYILAMGRLGSQTLSARSDIDLIFIFDGLDDSQSDGERPLGLAIYYMRLSQLIVSWLSVASSQGRLFEVDTRLRPDGKSGAVAVNMSRYATYYRESAWAWEHIALMKARPVASIHENFKPVLQLLKALKSGLTDKQHLGADIIKMRDRLKGETRSDMDFKKRCGGFLDLEFLGALCAVDAGIDLTDTGLSSEKCLLAVQKTHKQPDLDDVLEGAETLEKIFQYSRLCLPRYVDEPDLAGDNPHYQALTGTTGHKDMAALLLTIKTICEKINMSLSKRLANSRFYS